nr:immunoglobulin heavy chain junction region [Mus musculus]
CARHPFYSPYPMDYW